LTSWRAGDKRGRSPSGDPESGFSRGKWIALCFSFALIVAVSWPMWKKQRADLRHDFPLLRHPAFTTTRTDETLYYAVGVDDKGNRYFIPSCLIGDGDEHHVRRYIRRVVKAGHAPDLARQVARRLVRESGSPWCWVVSVSICKGRYSIEDFFHGRKKPESETVFGFAEVDRTKPSRGSTPPPIG